VSLNLIELAITYVLDLWKK